MRKEGGIVFVGCAKKNFHFESHHTVRHFIRRVSLCRSAKRQTSFPFCEATSQAYPSLELDARSWRHVCAATFAFGWSLSSRDGDRTSTSQRWFAARCRSYSVCDFCADVGLFAHQRCRAVRGNHEGAKVVGVHVKVCQGELYERVHCYTNHKPL